MKTILYTDGGCKGNNIVNNPDRWMVSAVTDEAGNVLIDKHQEGGSNNIAELAAVKEALLWAYNNGYRDVEIRTDSRNNFAWVLGKKVGEKINDRPTVMNLKTAIDALRRDVHLTLNWVPREQNLAGFYIEEKYSL